MTTGYVQGAPVSAQNDIQEARVGVGTPIRRKFINLVNGGGLTWSAVDDPGNNEVEVSAVVSGGIGPPGPPGPGGAAGPPGPAGPGFSLFSAGNRLVAIPFGGPFINTENFGLGFNWRMAGAASSQDNTQPDTAGTSVNNIVGWNTSTVGVQIRVHGGLTTGTAGVSFSASG